MQSYFVLLPLLLLLFHFHSNFQMIEFILLCFCVSFFCHVCFSVTHDTVQCQNKNMKTWQIFTIKQIMCILLHTKKIKIKISWQINEYVFFLLLLFLNLRNIFLIFNVKMYKFQCVAHSVRSVYLLNGPRNWKHILYYMPCIWDERQN